MRSRASSNSKGNLRGIERVVPTANNCDSF
jgi:hypothetical protein